MAEAMLGHGNQAYEYLRAYLPAAYNTKAEIREIEPYVVCQSTHAKYSPKHGASRIPWLSGSATWTYYAISQYILGIRPEYNGLTIDPCIPSDWDGFTATRKFKGCHFEIKVSNPNHVEKGVARLELNGRAMDANFMDAQLFEKKNKVVVTLG
jgi:cellobiose phosphorylase